MCWPGALGGTVAAYVTVADAKRLEGSSPHAEERERPNADGHRRKQRCDERRPSLIDRKATRYPSDNHPRDQSIKTCIRQKYTDVPSHVAIPRARACSTRSNGR